ncbi:MAG: signal peptidase II [Actinomycetota bacterium]
MRRRASVAFLYGAAAIVYVLDRLSKAWAEATLAGGAPIDLIPGVLRLSFVRNTGGAFSLGQRAPLVFAAATAIIASVIVVASARPHRRGIAISLGMILGGAVGNLTDRAVHGPGFTGPVTDFIDLHVWPVFNLADSAVVLGALALVLLTAREEPGRGERAGAVAP